MPAGNDALLNRFLRAVSKGDYIYKQGDRGNTMFILAEGTVLLFHHSFESERLVGTLGPGDILGEKAVLQDMPHRRTVSALAKTEVQLLEFDVQNLKIISSKVPDFPLKVLRSVTERLDEARELISILQLSSEVERLVHYMLFFSRHHYRKVPQGTELPLNLDQMQEAINLDKTVILGYLQEFITEKLVKEESGGYMIVDEDKLLAHLPRLKEKLAA